MFDLCIGVGAGKFLGVRKIFTHFVRFAYKFFLQRSWKPFWYDLQNIFMCFSKNVGRHCLKSNNVGRHFYQIFRAFTQIFKDFSRIFGKSTRLVV